MSTGEGEDVLIDGHLVARKTPHPNRETREVYDGEDAYRGRVVRAGGFQALRRPSGTSLRRGDVPLTRDSHTGSRGHLGAGPGAESQVPRLASPTLPLASPVGALP
jgi:hypothetical protein